MPGEGFHVCRHYGSLSAPSLPQSTKASRGRNAPGWGQGETCWADEG